MKGLIRCLLALLVASTASAQSCPDPLDIFHKNDILPDDPGGALTASIVPGLCEGEAIGSVFDILSGGAETVGQLGFGFGDIAGSGGFVAAVSVEVYNGVTFDGLGHPTLGPKIFDMAVNPGINVQVSSHAINVIDLTPYNVVVDNPDNKFVVAIRMEVNPNGNCAAGYTANPLTDATQNFSCVTTPGRNLIDISGQGWDDVTVANIGVPLCPLFINGNWLVRACTKPSNPLFVTVAGSPVNPGGFVNLTFNAPGYGGEFYVAAASKGTAPGIFVPHSGTIPLNYDSWFTLSFNAPGVFINFIGVISPSTETAPGIVSVPNNLSLVGKDMYVAFVAVPAAGPPWGISSASKIEIR